jgi:hypothetical protein
MEKLKSLWDWFDKPVIKHTSILGVLVIALLTAGFATLYYQQNNILKAKTVEGLSLSERFASVSAELMSLKSVDQVKLNQKLEAENKAINETFKKTSLSYEDILDLRAQNIKYDKKIDQDFILTLNQLSARNYVSASATLTDISKLVQIEKDKQKPVVPTQTAAAPSSATASNNPPGAGYQRQSVHTDSGDYTVDIIAADLHSTKVIVDTASDRDCSNDCPVLPLATYAQRSGAYAGINGSFFCPAEYPSCVGKTNSFDTLLMNKNKVYFNSANNVYSTVPAAIFSNGSARFVSQSQQWGRDTGVDGVIANYPLYVSGGNNNFGGSSDPKIANKGTRSFVSNKGSTVYIGYIYNAGAADAAAVLKTLGMENALGLDQGGSAALWLGGRYLIGPGRSIPNALLFVNR